MNALHNISKVIYILGKSLIAQVQMPPEGGAIEELFSELSAKLSDPNTQFYGTYHSHGGETDMGIPVPWDEQEDEIEIDVTADMHSEEGESWIDIYFDGLEVANIFLNEADDGALSFFFSSGELAFPVAPIEAPTQAVADKVIGLVDEMQDLKDQHVADKVKQQEEDYAIDQYLSRTDGY